MLAFLLVAGSFTTFRRRRLASPTSIVEIEATHPHVKCRTGACRWARPPPVYRRAGLLRQGVASIFRSVYSAPSIRRNDAMPRRRTNPLALAVLACLSERPMHPYEMAATMRTRGQDASIRLNYGSLYGVVETLLKRGLIEEQEVVREGRRPERTVYRITDDGRTEVDDWLARAARAGRPRSSRSSRPGSRSWACCRRNGSSRSSQERVDRAAGPAVGARCDRRGRDAQRRAARVPRRDGLRARAGGRRLRVHRTARGARSSRKSLDGVSLLERTRTEGKQEP